MTCPSCGHDGLPPLVCEHCGHRWYATPAPLDTVFAGKHNGCGYERPHVHPENAPDEAAYLAATPAPLDGHQTPGEFHDYRVACSVCGEPGFLHVSWRPEKFEETP